MLPAACGGALFGATPSTLAEDAPPTVTAPVRTIVFSVTGMDCSGCATGIEYGVSGLNFVAAVHASYRLQKVCVELSGELIEDSLAMAIANVEEGLGLGAIHTVPACPEGLRGELPDPWEGRAPALDVKTVSRGEEFALDTVAVRGKYTVVDFGARWCEPCHAVADTFAAALAVAPDLAVRAVLLEGRTAEESYKQPVVKQHLQYAPGIPFLIVYTPDGKVLHKGVDAEKALGAIDKHRAAQAKKKG